MHESLFPPLAIWFIFQPSPTWIHSIPVLHHQDPPNGNKNFSWLLLFLILLLSSLNRIATSSSSHQTTSSQRSVYQPNDFVLFTIVDILPKQLSVKLNGGSCGRIDIIELSDTPTVEQFSSSNEQYRVNQTLNVQVTGTRNIEQNSKHHRSVYELSLQKASSTWQETGERPVAFVDQTDEKSKGYWFYLSSHTRGYLPPEFVSEPLTAGQCCQWQGRIFHLTPARSEWFRLEYRRSSIPSRSNRRMNLIFSLGFSHFTGCRRRVWRFLLREIVDELHSTATGQWTSQAEEKIVEILPQNDSSVRQRRERSNKANDRKNRLVNRGESFVDFLPFRPVIVVHWEGWDKSIWTRLMTKLSRLNRSPSVMFFMVTSRR